MQRTVGTVGRQAARGRAARRQARSRRTIRLLLWEVVAWVADSVVVRVVAHNHCHHSAQVYAEMVINSPLISSCFL